MAALEYGELFQPSGAQPDWLVQMDTFLRADEVALHDKSNGTPENDEPVDGAKSATVGG